MFRGVIPEVPSFGTQLARGLGGGVGKGLDLASQLAAQMSMKKFESSQRQKLLDSLLHTEERQEGISEKLQGNQGRLTTDPFGRAKAAAVAGEHDLSRIFADEGKIERKEKFAREKEAEPKLLEMEDRLSNYKKEEMRFDRLGKLFSPEHSEKFPPAVLVGAFTKNGELSAIGQSLLSPEAQEAVKLITDEIKGAKDTFGARVTNFDAQTYLKTLPTLLNTEEGRERVLRDLKLMNKINQMEVEGTLDVIDRYGGSGKISLSKAKRIFAKEFEPKRKELHEEFVNPEKKTFQHQPDASLYRGKRMLDDETGQILVSDGENWIPEGEQ